MYGLAHKRGWSASLLVVAFLVAACSGGSGGSSSSSAASSAATSSAAPTTDAPVDPLAEAQARIDAHLGVPTYEPPGDPFDAKAVMAGKTIQSVPVNSAIDFTQFFKSAAERIASKVGFTFNTWQNEGSPSQWAQGISNGINEGASLIDMFAGIDPQQVLPQIKEAQGAGIPLVASDTYDLTQEASADVDAAIKCPCSDAARLMVDWVAVKTGGKGSVLVLTSSDVYASSAGEAAFKDQFAKVAPDMKVSYIDIPASEWASKIQPQVQGALVGDPEITYVLPIYDTMSIWATQAIKQVGRDVKIVTYNGTPSILKMMAEDTVIEMNVGQSNDWMSHVVLDQEMRIIGGLATNPDATWPLRIWTKDNLAEAGSPPSDSKGYGDSYQAGFLKTWGLG